VRLPLQWKVLLGYLVVAGVGMGMAGWLALDALERSDRDQLRVRLTAQARMAARRMARGEFQERILVTSTTEVAHLAALIDRTVGLLRHLIEQKKHTVVVNSPSELPPILGDAERLGQVFSNLLDNAVKYTLDSGTITIGATSDDRMVAVSVADTGIGIPLNDLPRIFERFYRVDKARSRELGGTGLGLAIVKHLVEGHGGTVSAESRGNGSRFVVRLPLVSSVTPAV
jgi:two-component system phosphate regulon sensor histidine kinase PhoR